MRTFLFILAFVATTFVFAVGQQAQAQTAYAIEDYTNLLRFDLTDPGTVVSTGPFTGAVNLINGIDFRPADGLLYGYSESDNAIVTIDPATAVTTFVSNLTTGSSTSDLGLDFNPVADRLRLVNTNAQNLAINVDTGATTVQTNLAYAPGDINEGTPPVINEAAYTNNFAGAASTKLYYLDYELGILGTTADPGSGLVTTVGSLGVTTNFYTGFDILTAGGQDFAYAILSDEFNFPGLYSIDLTTGEASWVGVVGFAEEYSEVFGLAIVPVPIPEPSSIVLLVLGTAAALRFRRRRA